MRYHYYVTSIDVTEMGAKSHPGFTLPEGHRVVGVVAPAMPYNERFSATSMASLLVEKSQKEE